MNDKTYYFQECIGNASQRHLSQKAKEALQKIENVVETFQKYYMVLYREFPKKFEFLMTLNYESFFWNGSHSTLKGENECSNAESERKQNKLQTTSMKINPSVPDFSQRHLLLSQAEKENYEPFDSGINSSIRNQNENIQNEKNATIICSTDEKTIKNDQKSVQPIISRKVKIFQVPEVDNKYSFCSDRKDTISVNHTTADKQSVSISEISKITDESHERKQNYSSSETPLIANLTTPNKNLENSVKVVRMPHILNQEYLCPNNRETKNKVSVCQRQNTRIPDNRDVDFSVYVQSNEKPQILDDNLMNNLNSIVSDKLSFNKTNSTEDNREGISFFKTTTISTTDNEVVTGIKVEQEKHVIPEENSESLYQRKNLVLFRSIPKVKHLNGVIELHMNAFCISDENSSPMSTCKSTKYCRIDHKSKDGKGSPKNNIAQELKLKISSTSCSHKDEERKVLPKENIGSPVAQDLNVNISSTNINRQCVCLQDDSSPFLVVNTSIQGNENNVLFGENQPSKSLAKAIMLSGYQTGISLPPPIFNRSDSNILLEYMTNFVKFCEKRVNSMHDIYNSFLDFQNHLLFLYSYIKDMEYIIHNIPFVNIEYSTKEFYQIELREKASKLIEKLTSLIKDVQTDITVLRQCDQRIQDLKSQNKPFIFKGMPIVSIDFLRMYAQNLKEIWEEMDSMVARGYSRSSLFFNTAHDFERLITNFVKYLIIIGMLKPNLEIKK